ncbi:Ig-like domain-containing protein [Tianweitania sp.]|uniref:Ig-like domain-containing protein n=1 Tax=Tianweitania sp. TaxID=2021634 RepID=UPI0028A084F0|nr:Ig-like domain-containing protein [Tianweitania sp.]
MTPARVVLFLIGLFLAGGLVAYGSGAFDSQQAQPQTASAPTSTPAPTTPKPAVQPQAQTAIPSSITGEPNSVAQQSAALENTKAALEEAKSSRSDRVTPSFDILRVEADGSTVVAGRAKPGADVEIVSDGTVLGQTKVSPNGDFAIALENPLPAGDHTLVLRSKGEGGSASSTEMAIVSVPADKKGQVLAMVQEPGQPSRLISLPEADEATSKPATPEPASTSTAATTAAPGQDNQAPAAASQPATNTQTAAVSDLAEAPVAQQNADANTAPTVEAVEIEGSMIYVAGRSAPGAKLRAYADDDFLGEATASPDGQFLVEAKRDLAVGKYTIRIDAIGADGATVTQRAAVPFEREVGEAVAAVAPTQESATPSSETAAAASTQPPAASSSAAASASTTPIANTAADPATAPSQTTAPALQAAKGAVIIRRGDSLWRISKRAYGRGVRYSTIYLANQDQIQNPNRIWPGQIFHMPDSTTEGEKADMTQLGDQATTRD